MSSAPSPARAETRIGRTLSIAALAIVAAFVLYLAWLLLVGGAGGGHSMDAGSMGSHASGANATDASGHSGSSSRGETLVPGVAFGLLALIACAGYVAGLAVWARVRRRSAFLHRHVITAAITLILVLLYLNARGSFDYNGHNWNRSFADASVVLYAVTLAIGPLARLWKPAARALEWRRETGIWATIAAIVHVGIFWEWSLGWTEWRRFFYPTNGGEVAGTLLGDRATGLAAGAFQVANVVGLVALAYALVLTLTSNDASQRWLKSGWTWIMKRATTMQILVLLHTWLFAYYLTREQTLPIGTLWATFWAVLLLQTLALGKTIWLRRGAPAPTTA